MAHYPLWAKSFSRLFLSSPTALQFPAQRNSLFVILLIGFCCLLSHSAAAASQHNQSSYAGLGMPAKYGEVIYQTKGRGSNHLYIIGISHRDPENGTNNDTTVETQAEIFRIGEWLSSNKQLQLLLPEGYFGSAQDLSPETSGLLHSAFSTTAGSTSSQMDNAMLHQKLADESCFTNAEMLLMDKCKLPASQVEDRQIYDAVRRGLVNLQQNSGDSQSTFSERLAELTYLQQTRTAALLQKIPAVIEEQISKGTIRNRSAMFTIGLNHLQDIIRYIQNDEISIDYPAAKNGQQWHYKAALNLLKDGYEITVIIPRTLADDRKLLQVTKLDRIFSPPESSPHLPLLN